MEKVFVKVRCSHLPDGTIRPESLEWEDGQAWEITRTIHVAAPADHEFEGIRYTVLIGSAEKYIYRTGNRWTYISNRELEELGEGLTRHYLENAHVQMAARCIDIEGLANYLGMTVVFETFAEEDRDKVGFLADGRTPLKIRRKGSIVSFCFPLGTIVLDAFLRQDKESGRRRFTIAHEIAHSVIEKHNPVPQFHRIYDSEHGYTFQELKAQLTMTENQADRLAAVILMPQFTVDQALRDFNKGRRIKVYGQNVYANEERRIISRMAAQVGVSFSAMQIRLRELDLLEYHPLDEYVEKNLLGGKADERLYL